MRYAGHLFLVLFMTMGFLTGCGGPPTALIPPETAEGPGGPDTPQGLGALDANDPANNAFASQVIELVNQQRAQNGCPAVAKNDLLTLAAYRHSEDMAQNDYFAHDGKDGSKFSDRISSAGYQFSLAAENLAAGTPGAEQAVQLWMDSPPHRANILNCGLTEVGVGYFFLQNDTGNVNFQHYVTQVFATP